MIVDEFFRKGDQFVVKLYHPSQSAVSSLHLFSMNIYQKEGNSNVLNLLIDPDSLPAFLDAMRNAVEEFEAFMPVPEA